MCSHLFAGVLSIRHRGKSHVTQGIFHSRACFFMLSGIFLPGYCAYCALPCCCWTEIKKKTKNRLDLTPACPSFTAQASDGGTSKHHFEEKIYLKSKEFQDISDAALVDLRQFLLFSWLIDSMNPGGARAAGYFYSLRFLANIRFKKKIHQCSREIVLRSDH